MATLAEAEAMMAEAVLGQQTRCLTATKTQPE